MNRNVPPFVLFFIFNSQQTVSPNFAQFSQLQHNCPEMPNLPSLRIHGVFLIYHADYQACLTCVVTTLHVVSVPRNPLSPIAAAPAADSTRIVPCFARTCGNRPSPTTQGLTPTSATALGLGIHCKLASSYFLPAVPLRCYIIASVPRLRTPMNEAQRDLVARTLSDVGKGIFIAVLATLRTKRWTHGWVCLRH